MPYEQNSGLVCLWCEKNNGELSIYCVYCGKKLPFSTDPEVDAERRADTIERLDDLSAEQVWGCNDTGHSLKRLVYKDSRRILKGAKYCGNCGEKLLD